MRMKYGTTNIIRNATGMGFTGVKPTPKLPKKITFSATSFCH